jgi:hypothetical protein
MIVKKPFSYDFFGISKVMNLWGDFEAPNDIFRKLKQNELERAIQ